MDVYIEHILKHKMNSKDYAKAAAIVGAALVLSALLIIFYRFTFGMGFLLIAAAWYFVYILLKSLSVEYEYIMTNSAVDIDKVVAKNGRKPVVSFDVKDVDIFAPADGADTRHAFEQREGIAKVYEAIGNPADGGIYFADFVKEEGKVRVIFQPTAEMVTEAKRFNPRNVYI